MKYSYNWIQKHIAEPLPEPHALAEIIIGHAFEVESVEPAASVAGADGDFVLDIKVLPDRAGDCFSHYGMAREIAGLLSLSLVPNKSYPALPDSSDGLVPVYIEDGSCDRYCAVLLEGVTIAPSPEWLVAALDIFGQKSINALVDMTNYLMLDTGQPMHAFDADKVVGALVIRQAREGEVITTLSGEEKVLTSSVLVIADQEKVLAIAGIKGGTAAAITDQTTRVILEIAHFDSVAIRKASRAVRLITDASRRFENNVSVALVGEIASRAAHEIAALCGGGIVGAIDQYPAPRKERVLEGSVDGLRRLLGDWVTAGHVHELFGRYSYRAEWSGEHGELFALSVPPWRGDITGIHDLAEEVGRVIGYDGIDPVPLPVAFEVHDDPQYQAMQAVRLHLADLGYSEVYTYSFCKKGEVYVAHGPKDRSALRPSIGPAILEISKRNALNAPLLAVDAKKIFEIGSVFTDEGESIMVATVTDGVLEELSLAAYIMQYGIAVAATYKNANAAALPQADAENIHQFSAWSMYPYIVRDVAVWASDYREESVDDRHALLQRIVEEFAAECCVVPVTRFDTFTKDGRTSMAFRFVFQSYDHTLTDAEVDSPVAMLTNALEQQGFAIR